MASAYHHKSGPRAQSCITCRQRRKKCDKARPACERCVKGKFECLGYDYTEEEAVQESRNSWRGVKMETKLILPRLSVASSKTEGNMSTDGYASPDYAHSGSQPYSTPSDLSLPSDCSIPLDSMSPQPTATLTDLFSYLSGVGGFGSQSQSARSLGSDASDEARFNDLWPQNQSQSLVRKRSRVSASQTISNSQPSFPFESSPLMQHLLQVMRLLCYSISPSIETSASLKENYFLWILKEYETRRIRKFFRPMPSDVRTAVIARVRKSGTYIWSAYLGANVYKALDEKGRDEDVQPYMYWIEKFDKQTTTDPHRNPPIEVLEDRLAGLLELAYLKFLAVSSVAGYSLLHRLLPTFLQVVATDPSLWVERNGLVVSLPRALGSYRNEIRRFVFYDIMIAFIFGLPMLVEYDVSELDLSSQPFEWVHGIPIVLIANIVQINAWRAAFPGIPNVSDWMMLEMRTMEWKPRVEEISGDGSVEVVSRLALQECWRHAVLIYIYMGMCCVSSEDIRVQYSVRQIIRLMNTIASSDIDVHLVTPCIVAGIAARFEQQRTIIQEKLKTFYDTRVWLCRGVELVPVMNHLWHGAARDGRAVTWEDYVWSRETMLPIA